MKLDCLSERIDNGFSSRLGATVALRDLHRAEQLLQVEVLQEAIKRCRAFDINEMEISRAENLLAAIQAKQGL